jgi:hypothetical protein
VQRLLLLLVLIVFAIAGRGVPIQEASAQTCPGGLMTQEWIDCKEYVLHACAFAPPGSNCENVALMQYAQFRRRQQQQMQCPSTHPIKGNFTTYNGERCIFHMPGGQFYNATKPEKCYATPPDAIADGCRQSLR